MNTTVHINEALPTDYAAIAAIYNEYIKGGGVTMDEMPKTADDITQWVAQFNERERLFTLSINNVILGWGIIKKYSDRSGYRTTCETAVYLTHPARGNGYGTLLKKHLLKVCESLGYRHIVAKILGGNEASIIYNQKLGYTIVGRQQQVGFRDGQWYDVVIMQYLIETRIEGLN